jgi:hypothetical protein
MVQLQVIPSHHERLAHSCQTVKEALVCWVLFDCSLDCLQVHERPFTEAFDHLGFGVLMDADFEDEQNKKLKMLQNVIQMTER